MSSMRWVPVVAKPPACSTRYAMGKHCSTSYRHSKHNECLVSLMTCPINDPQSSSPTPQCACNRLLYVSLISAAGNTSITTENNSWRYDYHVLVGTKHWLADLYFVSEVFTDIT